MIEKAKSVIDAAKEKMQNAVTYLDEDLKTYRAGKANPAVFNSVVTAIVVINLLNNIFAVFWVNSNTVTATFLN